MVSLAVTAPKARTRAKARCKPDYQPKAKKLTPKQREFNRFDFALQRSLVDPDEAYARLVSVSERMEQEAPVIEEPRMKQVFADNSTL